MIDGPSDHQDGTHPSAAGPPLGIAPEELGPNHVIADGSVTMSVGMLCFIIAMVAICAAALAGVLVLLFLRPSCRPHCRKGKPASSKAGPPIREPPTVMPSLSAYGIKVEAASASEPSTAAPASGV